jgi:hypothetical protein
MREGRWADGKAERSVPVDISKSISLATTHASPVPLLLDKITVADLMARNTPIYPSRTLWYPSSNHIGFASHLWVTSKDDLLLCILEDNKQQTSRSREG